MRKDISNLTFFIPNLFKGDLKMKSYNRKKELVLTAFIVVSVGLLFMGCPDPCDSSNCPYWPTDDGRPATKDFTFNGSRTASKNFTPPAITSGIIRDVMLNETTISIRTTVNDLIIIDSAGYGWQLNGSTSTGGPVTELQTPIRVFAKNSSNQWYQATGGYYNGPSTSVSLLTTVYSDLGLAGGYTVATLLSSLNTRFNNANTVISLFYPVAIDQLYGGWVSETVDGVNIRKNLISNAEPGMGFFLKDGKLGIVGDYTAGSEKFITFRLVVVRTSDGQGWVSPDITRTYKDAGGDSRISRYDISDLTGLNQSQLESTCAIYVIVKSTSAINAVASYYDRNVIRIYPDPYELVDL